MSLIDSHSTQPNGDLARGWMSGASAPIEPFRSDKPWRPGPSSGAESILSAAAFLEQIDSLSREVVRDEAMKALVAIKPSEIRTLVTQIAKTKGRYLAALLEFANQAAGKNEKVAELQSLRMRHEELSAGLTQLRAMILEGELEVEGVGF